MLIHLSIRLFNYSLIVINSYVTFSRTLWNAKKLFYDFIFTKAYLGLCQTTMIELSCKIVTG